ncbi:MAG: DUF1615 family protein [Deltaproteobacteria bacterium]|nr:DUF1615 family protein [Deltaproteobacteria bacterium]
MKRFSNQSVIKAWVIIIALGLFFSGCSLIFKKEEPPRLVKPALKDTQFDPYAKEKKQLESDYRLSREFFEAILMKSGANLSWEELELFVSRDAKEKRYQENEVQAAKRWLRFFKLHADRIKVYYDLPYKFIGGDIPDVSKLVFVDGQLITKPMASMWRHCKVYFNRNHPDWYPKLLAGYQTPAYQFLALSQERGSLSEIFSANAPPFYNRHQKSIPDITVQLAFRGVINEPEPTEEFQEICSGFGFELSYPSDPLLSREYTFPELKALYRDALLNPVVPLDLALDFYNALIETEFFPSPEGLRVIFALSEQESSLRWDPWLTETKKKLIRDEYYPLVVSVNEGLTGTISSWFFPKKLSRGSEELMGGLRQLIDSKKYGATEYDFYLWCQKAYKFLKEITSEYSNLTKLGQWAFDFESKMEQLAYEPQTFGLFQVNVNHLIEKMQEGEPIRRLFPKLYHRQNGKWKVRRKELISSLSGNADSVLDRQQTLELVIRTLIEPRYENHLLGSDKDLHYFASENLAGEFSTFRAALQNQLNLKMNSSLVLDGDLIYYKAYSTKRDPLRQSETQKTLYRFIEMNKKRFRKSPPPGFLIKKLVEANRFQQLMASKLYRQIMTNSQEVRVFPQIKSSLYRQSPGDYARKIMDKARHYAYWE